MMPSYVQDPITLKLVEKSKYYAEHPETSAGFAIHGEIEPFVSTVDGTYIDDRSKLRAHNKRNGVENVSDADLSYMKQRKEEVQHSRKMADKKDRQRLLKEAIYRR